MGEQIPALNRLNRLAMVTAFPPVPISATWSAGFQALSNPHFRSQGLEAGNGEMSRWRMAPFFMAVCRAASSLLLVSTVWVGQGASVGRSLACRVRVPGAPPVLLVELEVLELLVELVLLDELVDEDPPQALSTTADRHRRIRIFTGFPDLTA